MLSMTTLTEVAAKKQKRATKNGKPKTATRKPTTGTRSEVPWQKIADLYNAGKSTPEISDALDLTRPKTKDGKENKYPYYLVVGYLTKLSEGVKVDDKTIKIMRGKRTVKKAA